jgi:hypothetical protein
MTYAVQKSKIRSFETAYLGEGENRLRAEERKNRVFRLPGETVDRDGRTHHPSRAG